MSSTNVNSLVSLLSGAGVASSSISSIVTGFFGSSVASKVKPMLEQLEADSSSPAAEIQEINAIEMVAGVPPAAIQLLETLRLPGQTGLSIVQTVAAIETILAE